MRQQRRSLIWNFYDLFYERDKKYGSCKICRASVVCPTGSTTGLQSHLKTHHVEHYRQFQEDKLAEFHQEKPTEFHQETLIEEKTAEAVPEVEQIGGPNFPSPEETFTEDNIEEPA